MIQVSNLHNKLVIFLTHISKFKIQKNKKNKKLNTLEWYAQRSKQGAFQEEFLQPGQWAFQWV